MNNYKNANFNSNFQYFLISFKKYLTINDLNVGKFQNLFLFQVIIRIIIQFM